MAFKLRWVMRKRNTFFLMCKHLFAQFFLKKICEKEMSLLHSEFLKVTSQQTDVIDAFPWAMGRAWLQIKNCFLVLIFIHFIHTLIYTFFFSKHLSSLGEDGAYLTGFLFHAQMPLGKV